MAISTHSAKFKMNARAFVLLFLPLMLLSLVSCTKQLYNEGGNLVDRDNGITYIPAPITFEPQTLAAEPYAECSELGIELYEIEGLPGDEWLSEPFDGIGGVYYSDKLTLPTLEEFDADLMYICVEQVITVSIGTVDDKAGIDAIVTSFVSGEPTTIIQSGNSYKLKFSSDKYPGLYYNLIYIEGDDGENYIYDRSTQTCVDVGDVLQAYMPRED